MSYLSRLHFCRRIQMIHYIMCIIFVIVLTIYAVFNNKGYINKMAKQIIQQTITTKRPESKAEFLFHNVPNSPSADILKNEYTKCSDDVAKQSIQQTCDLYKQGRILGDLCPGLCEQQTVRYRKCTNHKGGKLSFLMDCEDVSSSEKTVPAMLKSKKRVHHESIMQSLSLSSNTFPFKNIEDLHNWVLKRIKTVIDPNNPNISTEDIFKRVFYESYENVKNSVTDKAFILSVWSLVIQDEYLITKLHQDSPLFPKIYNSCGSFYLLESAPPQKIIQHLDGKSTWEDFVNAAITVLDVIKVVDNDFHQTLYMCDNKRGNFGLNREGQLKLIDVDMVCFASRMESEMLQKGRCKTDTDCKVRCGCQGICLKERCSHIKIRNLKGTCKLLSRSAIEKVEKFYKSSALIKQLQDTLNICIEPNRYNNEQLSDEQIRLKLRNLLLSSL